MRPVSFTDETVIQAGKDLLAAGRNITGFALRKAIGGGNPSRLKQVWDEHQASSEGAQEPVQQVQLPVEVVQVVDTISADLSGRINALAVDLNTKATKAAERMVNEVLKTAGEQRQQADRELQDAADTVDDLEEKLDLANAKIAAGEEALAKAVSEAQAHAVELAKVRERLAASEKQVTQLKEESEQAKREVVEQKAALATAVKDHKQAVTALESERDQARRERESTAGELATVKARAEAANGAHEDHRKREAAEIQRLNESIKRIEGERNQATKEAGSARESAAKLQGKVEALQEQLATAAKPAGEGAAAGATGKKPAK